MPNEYIPDTCIRGSTAAHGQIIFFKDNEASSSTNHCLSNNSTKTEEAYQRVKQYTTDILQDNNNNNICDVCRIMDIVTKHNITTITFWGDSIHNQFYHGFICELSRRNYKIVEKSIVDFEYGHCVMTCYQYVQAFVFEIGGGHKLRIQQLFQYKPKDPRNVYKDFDKLVELETQILIFNFGLHFGKSYSDYEYHIRGIFNELIKRQKQQQQKTSDNRPSSSLFRLVAFRETSTQHFPEWWTVSREITSMCSHR